MLKMVLASVMIFAASHSLAQGASTPLPANTFTNPLLSTGPDPWVVWWNGFYYYSNSTGANLTLRKTADITDLQHAETKAVWTPEPGHPWSKELWAPELHRWGNKWYIYFAADAGDNASHRIYVVENDHDDPLQGGWTLKGQIKDASDRWAIDATTFEVMEGVGESRHGEALAVDGDIGRSAGGASCGGGSGVQEPSPLPSDSVIFGLPRPAERM